MIVDGHDECDLSFYDWKIESWKPFGFDHVWPPQATQADVFSDIEPLIASVAGNTSTSRLRLAHILVSYLVCLLFFSLLHVYSLQRDIMFAYSLTVKLALVRRTPWKGMAPTTVSTIVRFRSYSS